MRPDAGHHQPWRRGFELAGQELAAQREPPGELADAFVAGKEIVHAHAHVVPRHVKGAGAGGGELQQA